MICNYFSQPSNVLDFLEVSVSISLTISSIQHFKNINCFSNDGLLPWYLFKKNYKPPFMSYGIFDHLFDRRGMFLMNMLRIIMLPLLIIGNEEIHLLILFLITLLTILIYIRSAIMCNAADQVNNIILTGLLIHYLLESAYGALASQVHLDATSNPAVIYFFASLLIISYCSSGLLKIHQIKWRNGVYLKQVMVTRNFRHPILLKVIRGVNRRKFKYISQMIIIWQVTSFLMPLLPNPLFYFYLFMCFSFHLVTGFLLRLNSFIWTFTGLLPCLIYAHEKIFACL